MNDRRSEPEGRPAGVGDAEGAASPRTIRHLSHDIRAAMSDVLGGLRLIDPRRLDPQTQTQMDRVKSAADTLASLVDHALFEAVGESPVIRDRGPVYLGQWLASLSHRWRGQAAEQGREFHILSSADLPAQLAVPPVALTRLVGNLVGNALRHATEGAVEVHVYSGAGGGLAISVRDYGPGLPEAVLEHGGAGAMGRHAGSGLGLKIARDLSEGMGAELSFENLPSGASATLWLGPHLVMQKAEEPVADRQMPDLSALRLLVAEDNLTNQTILRHMLDAMGAETVFVADGRSALQALEREAFDIALLDIEMPDMSGLEVMEAVRSLASPVATMPLVAITAYVLRDNREAIYAAGADGIIGKPVASAEDLGLAILRHVGRVEPEAMQVDAPMSGIMAMDQERMEQLLDAAGPEESAELLARLEEDLRVTLEVMDRAIEVEDASELRAQTHILIAISGAVGADRLCHNSEVLNVATKRKSRERFATLYHPVRADLLDLIEEVVRRRGEDSAGG